MKTHYDAPLIASHVTHVTRHADERIAYLASLTPAIRMSVFNDVSTVVQDDILDRAPTAFIVQLIDHFDHDRAHVYLRRIKNHRRRNTITTQLKRELKQKIEQFTAFHVKAAHELVHFNYILLPHTATISEAADAIAMHRAETGRIPEVLIRKDGMCIGEIDPHTLILRDNAHSIGQYIVPVEILPHTASAAEIAKVAMNSIVQKIIVTDAADGSVVGVVYTSDIIALFEEKPSESLYNFAGLEENEHPFDPPLHKFSARAKWLVVNLMTTFLAASIVVYFHTTLAAVAALAVFMPIIAGMGANSGTQAFAVFLRGITLGEVSLKNALPAVRSEILAALLQGALHGGLIVVIALTLGYSIGIGIVAGLSVMCGLLMGVTAGSVVPLVLHKFNKDPGLTSGIVITTFTDVFGLLTLFGLATLFLL